VLHMMLLNISLSHGRLHSHLRRRPNSSLQRARRRRHQLRSRVCGCATVPPVRRHWRRCVSRVLRRIALWRCDMSVSACVRVYVHVYTRHLASIRHGTSCRRHLTLVCVVCGVCACLWMLKSLRAPPPHTLQLLPRVPSSQRCLQQHSPVSRRVKRRN
jgi:hypothetical protein